MLGDRPLVAFVGVANLARARFFYESVLGLRIIEVTPFALVADANGTTLRITPVPTVSPHAYTALGWTVADLAASLRALEANGVPCLRYPWLTQDEDGVWHAPDGARIAWFNDPDGNVLSLHQA